MTDPDFGAEIVSEVTPEEARSAEASLLAYYGLANTEARNLIDDVRAASGLDRFLREAAKAS